MNLFRALLSAISSGTFFPVESGLQDYSVKGEARNALLDANGNLVVRSAVLTDEGSHRDDFSGNVLDPVYTSTTAGGGAISVANSLVTFTIPAGAPAGAVAYISHEVDFLPLIFNLFTNAITRVAGCEFFFGLYSGPDLVIANATEFAEASLPNGSATTMTVAARSFGDAANFEQVTGVACSTTANPSWRTIIIEADGGTWRDGSSATNALPTTTVRTRLSRHTPSNYSALYFAMGLRRTGLMAGSASADVDTINIRNINRLDVMTTL